MDDFAAQVLAAEPDSAPRYTSYPPANHFIAGEGRRLEAAFVAAAKEAAAISAYIHVPFCDRLCWFCGCHTKHTLRYEPVAAYVGTVLRELALWREKLGGVRPALSRLHLGGGSPSLLSRPDLERLRQAILATFTLAPNAEVSIEIDPSDVREGTIAALMDFGLTRASIGVQDFDPVVQAAINRPQSFEDTARVVAELRSHGVASVNIDALYGLPLQTEERLASTIAKVVELRPDRVALFGYAHVPWMKPHQKLIHDSDLPGTESRFAQAKLAASLLVEAGYASIGIDHFALPHDALAAAAENGELHRNFQGYTDDDANVLLGFGPSSIGRFPGGFVQNEVATGQYTARVMAGELPLARGLALTADDEIRGFFIERLMCDFAVSLDELVRRFGEAGEVLAEEARRIAAADQRGLCEISNGFFAVAPRAWPFVRLVAAKFDAWLEAGPQRYSKAV